MRIHKATQAPVTGLNRLGFAGAHRTGKSTMARSLSLNFMPQDGIIYEFVPAHVSKAPVWAECHMTPSEQLTFAERVVLQQGILDHMKTIYQQAPAYAVYDRTPIDFVGYLMANVDTTCSNLFTSQVERFIGDCIRLTMQANDKIIIIQPAIKAEEDAGKTGKTFLSKPYQMAVNNHIIATCVKYLSQDKYLIVPDHIVETDARLEFIRNNL